MGVEGRFAFIPIKTKTFCCLLQRWRHTIMSITKTALTNRKQWCWSTANRQKTLCLWTSCSNFRLLMTITCRLSISDRKKVPDALFGRIDMSHINYVQNTLFSQLNFDAFYVCGPSGMMEASVQALSDSGVSVKTSM